MRSSGHGSRSRRGSRVTSIAREFAETCLSWSMVQPALRRSAAFVCVVPASGMTACRDEQGSADRCRKGGGSKYHRD